MMLFVASCSNTNVKQETYVPVQNNIVKPSRPNSVIAPEQHIHIITKGTQGNKLNENDVYIGYTWDEYIENIKFHRDILQYIQEQNNIIEYYEETIDDLNSKDYYSISED